MSNASSSNTDWIQLSIFDLQPFHKDKPKKRKKCARCKKNLDLANFANDVRSCDGKSSQCKACLEVARKARDQKRKQGIVVERKKKEILKGKKRCCKCREILPMGDFCPSNYEKAAAQCKKCMRTSAAERRSQRSYLITQPISYAYKQCSKCLRYIEVTQFRRTAKNLTGLDSWCINCDNESTRKYKHSNKADVAAYNRTRKLTQKQVTPTWANKSEIKNIYQECLDVTSATGIKHHVDHCIPVTHPLVVGLHTHSNLRVITEFNNCSKNNSFTPYVFSDLTPEQQQSPLYNPFWRETGNT